jgi:predicted nucleic acid-binding protein
VRGMKKPKNERIEDLQNQIIKKKKFKITKTRKKLMSLTPLSHGEWSSFVINSQFTPC